MKLHSSLSLLCRIVAPSLLSGLLIFTGCSGSHPSGSASTSPPPPAPALVKGTVRGGQVPVTGASLQLYAVGTTGDGSSATPLLTQPLASDASGNFSLTGAYTCPSPSSLVYVTASGGNPGLGSGTNNTASLLIAALGPCSTVPTSFIVNEVTTVAAIWPLASFMSSPTAIGSTAADASDLSAAFSLAAQFADVTTGVAPGSSVPTGTTIPSAEINTLADILSACVNSAGGVAGDGSPCGQLFSLTTPVGGPAPATIAAASRFIEQNPAQNISQLFALLPANAPFTPMLSIPPVDWGIHPAVPSALAVTPSSIDFPSTIVNFTAASQNVTLTNSGSTAIDLSGIVLTGANAGDFTINNSCTSSLPSNQTCSIQVSFSPTAAGSKYAYLTIANSATSQPVAIALTGTAVDGSGALSVSPPSLSFSQLSVPQTITLTNSSASAIAIQSISLSNQNFTESHTCGSSIAANASCTLSVTAAIANSDSATPLTATLTIIAADTIGVHTIPLSTNIAQTLPPLSVTPLSTLAFAPTLPYFSTAAQTLTITNTTPNAISFSISLQGAAANNYTLNGSTCFQPFLGGQSCTIQVAFTPTSAGAHNGSIQFAVTSGATGVSPVVIPVTGTALAATGGTITLSPSSLTFTQFGVPAPVTVTNTGTTPVAIGSIAFSNSSSSTGTYSQTNNCGSSLDPQSVCTIQVAATEVEQNYGVNGTLVVIAGDAQGTHSVSLSTLAAPATISVPGPVAFGSWPVGVTSVAQTLDYTEYPDLSDIELQISGPNANDFSFAPDSVVSSQTISSCYFNCSVSIYFTPDGLGPRTATLTTTLGTATLTGTGAPAGPSFVLSGINPTPFYQVNGTTSGSSPITVTNNGSTPLSLSETMTGANASQYLITKPCPVPLAVASTCTFDVAFAPTQFGSLPAVLNVTDTTSGMSQTANLMGYGLYPPPTASPNTIRFGDTQIGSVAGPMTTTLTALDGHPVTISIANKNSEFGVTTTSCSATPCQIGVTFSPTVTGIVSDLVTVQDVVTGTSSTIYVSGTGGVPAVSLSPSSLSFAARNTGSNSIAQVVTLTNTGNALLNISTISIGGANAADFTQTNTCNSPIAVGATCTLSLSFSPSETGNLSATVQILSNAPAATIDLTGTATTPSP